MHQLSPQHEAVSLEWIHTMHAKIASSAVALSKGHHISVLLSQKSSESIFFVFFLYQFRFYSFQEGNP